MTKTIWKRLMAPGRKSDLVMAVVLVLTFLSFEFSDRSSGEMIKHCLAAFGFLWMYLRYMEDFDIDRIGIYTVEEGAATEDQIVRLADEAAYAAKNAGKNRVVVKTHA